jgi:hypothetical protein
MKTEASGKIAAFKFRASAWTHLIAIGFIGCLFAGKYLPRHSIGAVPAALMYIAVYAVQVLFVSQLASLAGAKFRDPVPGSFRNPKWILAAVVALWIAAMLPLYLRIDPAGLNVDRWSALENFWRAAVRGDYPYQMKSHLDHNISGFPGLFLLAAPFHFLGDVGLMQFAGLAAFAALAWTAFRDLGKAGLLLGLLLFLPSFLYEVACRSDLFSNMVAVAWALYLGSKPAWTKGGRLLLWGAAWGLLLSTRGVVLIPLILLTAHHFRARGFKATLGFGTVVTAVLLLTFVPFYLWNPRLFWEHNPFYVQSGYIPGWLLALVMLGCAIAGLMDKDGRRLFTMTGAAMFATLLFCLGLKAAEAGLGFAIANSVFDITYFSLSLPFLLISLGISLRETGAEPVTPSLPSEI